MIKRENIITTTQKYAIICDNRRGSIVAHCVHLTDFYILYYIYLYLYLYIIFIIYYLLLDNRRGSIFAHCVHLTDSEWARLAATRCVRERARARARTRACKCARAPAGVRSRRAAALKCRNC